MHGATDGGAYIEALRTEHMKSGSCELCGAFSQPLERHHEKYSPERCIFLCHACHHRAHFRPYHLTDAEKVKLLETRHGSHQWQAFERKPHLAQLLVKEYIAPGRRDAQLAVRRAIKSGHQPVTLS